MRRGWWFAALLLLDGVVAGCSLAHDLPDPPNRPVVPDLRAETRRSADEAVAVTRGYLAAMRREIAAPELHVVADVTNVWAIAANDAWTIDPCIPKLDDLFPVWITEGRGDYLNLRAFVWSNGDGQFDTPAEQACNAAAPTGTIVIDDLTGQIFAVFPGRHGP